MLGVGIPASVAKGSTDLGGADVSGSHLNDRMAGEAESANEATATAQWLGKVRIKGLIVRERCDSSSESRVVTIGDSLQGAMDGAEWVLCICDGRGCCVWCEQGENESGGE